MNNKWLALRAQSTLEYALIISAVTGALVVMGTYVRRAVQANLKQTEIAINGSVAESISDTAGSSSSGLTDEELAALGIDVNVEP